MISLKHENALLDAFHIGVVLFDEHLKISEANGYFTDLCEAPIGADIASLANAFMPRKFEKEVETPQGHRFKITPKVKQRRQYHLAVRPLAEGYIGMVLDSSDLAKSEAMLASYSLLIEQQNREIKDKNEQIEIWRARIEEELSQAAHVQDLLVPLTLSSDHITSRCQYLREMSGDFHEMAEAEDGSTTLIVGDVAGKGIYAAIMLAQTLTAFRSFHHLPTLTDVVSQMVEKLEGRFPDGLFVALTLVRQSADKQTVCVLNLGNPAALLIDKTGHATQIDSSGPAIGILPAAFYQTLAIEEVILTDKRLLVFSDGIIDVNLGGDIPTLETSQDVVRHIVPLMNLFDEAPFDGLFEALAAHEQSDDIVISHIKP